MTPNATPAETLRAVDCHGYADDGARVYAATGQVAHLLEPGDLASAGDPAALCGRRLVSWLGTGNQAEYEHAARLPLCGKCEFVCRSEAARWAHEEPRRKAAV